MLTEKLNGLLYPKCSALCDKSSIEQVHYRYEKVAMYLSNSKERSIETAIEKVFLRWLSQYRHMH